jgi:hypothetical protein
MFHDSRVAADHQAVPALEAEHTAAGADIDVLDFALGQRRRAVDIVAVVGCCRRR